MLSLEIPKSLDCEDVEVSTGIGWLVTVPTKEQQVVGRATFLLSKIRLTSRRERGSADIVSEFSDWHSYTKTLVLGHQGIAECATPGGRNPDLPLGAIAGL